MIRRPVLIGSMASFLVLLGAFDGAIAQMSRHTRSPQPTEQTGQFHRIDQPLWVKATVITAGLGLIGLELWWFLLSKPENRQVPR